MEKEIDMVLDLPNGKAYGVVVCEFTFIDRPANFSGHPDNWTPDESEYYIKVIDYEFTDEDGGEIEVKGDIVQDEIDYMDYKGEFKTIWEEVMSAQEDTDE